MHAAIICATLLDSCDADKQGASRVKRYPASYWRTTRKLRAREQFTRDNPAAYMMRPLLVRSHHRAKISRVAVNNELTRSVCGSRSAPRSWFRDSERYKALSGSGEISALWARGSTLRCKDTPESSAYWGTRFRKRSYRAHIELDSKIVRINFATEERFKEKRRKGEENEAARQIHVSRENGRCRSDKLGEERKKDKDREIEAKKWFHNISINPEWLTRT